MLEAARKYAQKGAKDRALKEYEALLKLDPRDAKLRLEVGDAHRRWGQVEEAAAAYRRVAEQYTAEGFDARAVAVYKQIQSLDPKGYAACEPLAELYQRMGLASEAIAALQAAADGHARDGKKRHALDLLRRMVALDPANTTSRIKVADLLRQEKLLDEAAVEYDAACAELERQGETEAAGRVIERLLELGPDRVDVLARLARNLLARGKADQAEAPARRAAERQPQEIAHHELLAEVYRAQKRDDRLVEAYRRIAELYRLRGDEEQARDIMQRFVPMAAFEAPARDVGAAEDSPFGSEPLELDEPDPDRGLAAEEDFLDEPAPVTRSQPARPAPARAPDAGRLPRAEPSRRGPAAAVADESAFELGAEEGSRILGDAEQLLAEASVYLRYGKRVQAIENLQAILARDPRHRAALEKLGDAYADDGDTGGAVAAWLRAGELARDDGDLEAMGVLRDRVAALDAAAAATLEPDEVAGDDADEDLLDLPDLGDAAGTGAQDPAPPDGAEAEIGEEIGGPLGAGIGEEIGGEIEIDVDLDAGEAAAEPASAGACPAASDPERVVEDLEEAEFYLQQGLAAEARALFERVLASSPGHPLALVRLGELAAAAGEDPDAPGAEAPVDRSVTPLVASAPRPLADETDPDGAWIAGDDDPFLDEPDAGEREPDPGPDPFLVPDDQGADDPVGLGGGVAAAAASVAPARGPAAPAAAADAFDLAAELSAALDEAEPDGAPRGAAGDEGFRAVFGAFKRGVQEALGQGDHEAHYDLGIAYREMGLLDDAIGEFRSAMASPARRIDCLHMLGLCALEQGRPDEAVDCLAHALSAPEIAQEQELAIRFELGRAYQQSGDAEKARAAWEKVASVDPEFCEVSELLATLAERRAPADGPAAEFESFDDLLEDDEDPPRVVPEAEAPPEREPFDERSAPVRADAKAKPKPRRRKISFV
jgi:tetratricopeptide (TPR) repeat protein